MDCVGHIVYLDVVLVDQGHVDRVVHGHVDRVVVLESVGRVGQNVLEKICPGLVSNRLMDDILIFHNLKLKFI